MNYIPQKVYELLEWDRIVSAIEERAQCEPGKKYAREIAPLDEKAARERIDLITEMRTALIEGETCDFAGITDIAPKALRASKGSTLGLDELFAVRTAVRSLARVRNYFSVHKDKMPGCDSLASTIDPCAELNVLLTKAFIESGDLNGTTYPQIGRIEKLIHSIKSDIERQLSKLIHSPHMEDVLQEKIHTTRGDRYVILVKANMKSRVKGTVVDISGSSSTLYVEPDSIAPLNDEILMRRAELEREMDKICAELSESVGYHAEPITHNVVIASKLDFLLAAAKFSRDTKGAPPVITDEPVIELFIARHPMLTMLIKDEVVANDVSLGRDFSAIVITGANTGGKTVLLKTIALAALMAMHGLHISASPDSRIGIFTTIMTDIGDDQNLDMSLSTFSGQVVALNDMIAHAHDRALILIDEIMAGTNPRHGAALAQSILERLADKGARVAVTTHYPELRYLAPNDPRFRNGSVSFNVENLKPTYELVMGIPGASFTFEIASKYGMDQSIITRAEAITSSEELSTEALIEKINQYKDEIANEKLEAEKLARELAYEKETLAQTQRQLKEETRRVKKGEGLAFIEELRACRETVAAKIKALQNADIRTAGKIQEELIAQEKEISKKVARTSGEALRESHVSGEKADIEPGMRVIVVPLEKEGIVEEVNGERKSAVVRLGNVFSRFAFSDLLIAEQDAKPAKEQTYQTKARRVKTDAPVPLTIQTAYNTIDLRGKRVDEALIHMENELDRMMRGNIQTAVIIHGHGTGAVKEAVRKNLKLSPYVTKYRAGEQSEGGDGVSIALLAL